MRIQLVNPLKLEVCVALKALQDATFAPQEHVDPTEGGWWWLVRDEGAPVAFAALLPAPSWKDSGYMARCGVLKAARGQGLQRKLLKKREDHAKAMGMKRVFTTTYNNPASANNLIARGYRTYIPAGKWGAQDTIYWRKDLE